MIWLMQPATITVCDANCDFTTLQAAIDAADAGDTILLQEGKTFTLTATMKVKAGAGLGAITEIRTGVNATGVVQATSRYVPDGYRVCPADYTLNGWYV